MSLALKWFYFLIHVATSSICCKRYMRMIIESIIPETESHIYLFHIRAGDESNCNHMYCHIGRTFHFSKERKRGFNNNNTNELEF